MLRIATGKKNIAKYKSYINSFFGKIIKYITFFVIVRMIYIIKYSILILFYFNCKMIY